MAHKKRRKYLAPSVVKTLRFTRPTLQKVYERCDESNRTFSSYIMDLVLEDIKK